MHTLTIEDIKYNLFVETALGFLARLETCPPERKMSMHSYAGGMLRMVLFNTRVCQLCIDNIVVIAVMYVVEC